MKKQFFATLIGLSLSINGMAYLGPNDKKGGDDETPKGANCSPATAQINHGIQRCKCILSKVEVCSKTDKKVHPDMRFQRK